MGVIVLLLRAANENGTPRKYHLAGIGYRHKTPAFTVARRSKLKKLGARPGLTTRHP